MLYNTTRMSSALAAIFRVLELFHDVEDIASLPRRYE